MEHILIEYFKVLMTLQIIHERGVPESCRSHKENTKIPIFKCNENENTSKRAAGQDFLQRNADIRNLKIKASLK